MSLQNPALGSYRALGHYNAWINERLYALVHALPEERRRADLGAYFGSIHGTLSHILWADRIWLARFTDAPLPTAAAWGTDLYPDFGDLGRARNALDGDILAWVGQLTMEDLCRNLTVVSRSDQKERRGPLWAFLTHFFNHQTHHRGQVTTLMHQLGQDPGVMDLPFMPHFMELR